MAARMLTGCQAAEEMRRLANQSNEISLAVAWATEGDVTDAILQSCKVSRAVVGTHMYITAPATLRRLAELPNARVVAPDKPRLFHPKVYLFKNGKTTTAVVGSHNLTANAFASNIEASVLVETEHDDKLVQELRQFIADSWQVAEPLGGDFLFSYEKQYEAMRTHRQALLKFRRIQRPAKDSKRPSLLNMSWQDFVRRVKAVDLHDFEKRLELLERARLLFAQRLTFEQMNLDERKAIAGTYGKREPRLDNIDWGWFGTMFPMGTFKNLVNTDAAGLSAALDHIPPTNEVTQSQYEAYVSEIRAAFAGKARQGGYAVASRLLAMKRPDVFVAVNSRNRETLCEDLMVAHSTIDIDNFWERIVEPIRLCPWWRADRPSGRLDARLWDCRAAMLDSIYYVGHG